MNNFVKENSTKWKENIFKKSGQAFDILGKPLMSGYLGGDFISFRPKVGEILNFEKIKNYH